MSGRQSLTAPLGGGTITLTMESVNWMQLPLADRARLLALVDAMDEIRRSALGPPPSPKVSAKLGEAVAIGAEPDWEPPRDVAEHEISLLVEGSYMTVSLGVALDLHAFCVSRLKRAHRAAPPLYSIRCDSCRTIVNDAVELPPPGVVGILANHYAAIGRRK